MKEVLVSFKHETHYGNVYGIYIINNDDWKKIRFLQSEKEEIWISEHAGKFSEEPVSLDKFVLISKSEDEIELFRKMFGRTFGDYAPFDRAIELYEELYNEEEGE